MVCIAMDAAVGVQATAEGPAPDATARRWALESTAHALACGGTYYLPYFRFADRALFRKAYPGWQEQQGAIANYNPARRFWNSFLDQYLNPATP